uniref:Transmembrane protein 45B n=2 Tax=Ciona intestinalis TaxID=7719 RepID=F6SQ23_CIOIN|nr:transmembrane protein 45B isoform X1 [Ciona intestinalis]|eukprot:XP_002124337.1 transmembrane protein 45B isoform X1 [Ciona intestinalis]
MGSYGGHVLPGSFFLCFGFWYMLKYSWNFLRGKGGNRNGPSYCCGKIPCYGIVVEGIVKVVFISIGILVELFYPGSPGGHLHNSTGGYTHPMNWQHATMYFFFGISGVADIVSHTARHVVPAGMDRLFGGLALFIEGYLFFFHLHGRSHIDTRVHILLVLTVWPSALFAFIECLVMNKRKLLHIFEMLHTVLLIAQGTWFWQAAYILYPPDGNYWDPCSRIESEHNGTHMQHHGAAEMNDCNSVGEAEVNLMFITLFWSWHIAAVFGFVSFAYFLIYKLLKSRGLLDPQFMQSYKNMNGGTSLGSSTPLNGALLSECSEDEL